MGFFTELFARPRPSEPMRHRAALAAFNAMHPADQMDFAARPADFPRVPRGMAMR